MNNNYLGRAKRNLSDLSFNLYPGRGIIIGMDPSGEYLVQVYFIMGRSENSRNRVFEVHPNGGLRTAFADQGKGGDPSLVIYNAMLERHKNDVVLYGVSNGAQTENSLGTQFGSIGSELVRSGFTYEPDKPNFTPRITGRIILSSDNIPICQLSVMRKSEFSETCCLSDYSRDFTPGLGWCIHTYKGDGNPLPCFEGEPYLVPIKGSTPKDVAEFFWPNLNEENRVSIAVKFIEIATGKSEIKVINKYKKVG